MDTTIYRPDRATGAVVGPVLRTDPELLCRLTASLVAAHFGVRWAEMSSPTRRVAPVSRARQMAMYLAHVVFGLSLNTVGQGFGRDRTTVAHACRIVEDRRDDPAFDDLLVELEDLCRVAARRTGADIGAGSEQ